MRKNLSSCADCGEDSPILTQVSSGPEIIFPVVTAIILNTQMNCKKKLCMLKKKIKNKKKEFNYYGLGKFNYLIFKFLCSRFRF